MKPIFKSKITWGIAGLVLLFGGAIAYNASKPVIPEYTSTQVTQGTLIQTVEETGTVVSNVNISYGWETSGRVIAVNKKVGDEIKKGDVIAQLENRSEAAALSQAQASLAAAQANLNQALAGPKEQQKAQSQAQVAQAEAALRQAEASLDETKANTQAAIITAQSKLDSAENDLRYVQENGDSERILEAYATLINSMKSSVTTLRSALVDSDDILGIDNTTANDEFEELLGVLNSGTKNTAESSYYRAKNSLNAIEASVISLTPTSDRDTIDGLNTQIQSTIQDMQTLLYNVRVLLEHTISGNDLSTSELSALKTGIETARSAVNTTATSLTTATQSLASAKNSLSSYKLIYDQAQVNLLEAQSNAIKKVAAAKAAVDIKKAALDQVNATYEELIAPPRDVDVASLRADVARNRSIVSSRAHDYNKKKLVALSDGLITKLDIDIGENAAPNSPVVTVISDGLSIDLDISESDIAKISTGDMAHITLDAFDEHRTFQAEVIQIDPAETQISGVVYYTIKLVFTDLPEDHSIKPGMTANVTITTAKEEDVLIIPSRAVLEENDEQYVRVLKNSETAQYERQPVTLGLRGNEGMVVVTSGVDIGQEIITFIEEVE